MPKTAPHAVDLADLTGEDWRGDALLVVTAGPAAASAGLMLPFRRARICCVDDTWDVESLTAELKAHTFDTVVIDGPSLGPARRDAAAARAGECVQGDGRIVVLMDGGPTDHAAGDHASDGAAAVRIPGLVWDAVAMLDGRPCAVLRPQAPGTATDPAGDDVAGRLATMAQTLEATRRGDAVGRPARAAAARAARGRYSSERALLEHLRGLAGALAAEREERSRSERQRRELEKQNKALQTQHSRLLGSKLGTVTVRYWQLRKSLRRRLER